MIEYFTVTFTVVTFASALRLATPYLLASLGETLGQRAGVLNLGVDGIMLLGAFFAYWTVLRTGNVEYGLLAGLATGAVMGIIYAVITLVFRAEQGISGIGLFLFGLGMSELLFQEIVGTPTFITSFDNVKIPLLGDIPKVGDALFHQSYLVYVAIGLVPIMSLVINHTTFGLNVRAVGETPEAADSLGVSVFWTRAIAIVVGSSLAGLAGGALTIEASIFQNNITNQIGFIAVALVYFGGWKPSGVLAGSLLYGFITAAVAQWKTAQLVTGAASSFATMAPAALTVVALIVIARRAQDQPAALTLPFERGN